MGNPVKYLKNIVTLEIDEARCTGCRRCIEVCPRSVLIMEGGKSRITDIDLCIECGACLANCEFVVIRVQQGVGCASAIIGSMISGGEPECSCCDSDEATSCC